MNLTAAVQLLALWSVYFFPACKAQIAVIEPLSYTAPLGSAGTFHCAVTGSNTVYWYVDRIPSVYPSVLRRGIFASPVTSINTSWIQSNLTVSATLENDGISINCIALAFVNGEQMRSISENARFHVEGPPSPPVNLTLEVSGNQSLLTLRWNSPSGTTLSNDSIISMYTVYVNIFRTGTETYHNTTMRVYSMKNPCSDVKFKVTAWDDIGEGTAATYLIYRHNLTEVEAIIPKTLQASVTFAASGEPAVQLLFQVNNRCFHQRLKVDLQVFLVNTWSNCSDFTQQQGPLMLEPTIVNLTIILNILHLPTNCRITATVQSQNVSNSSNTIAFATYGVQDVDISEGSLPNSICATCIFAEGTSVQGCYVHLFEEHYSVVTNISGIRIGREGDLLIATRCIDKPESKSDVYHVVVYDIEADGTVDWHNRALSITASLALNLTSTLNQDVPSDLVSTVIPSNTTMQEELTVFVTVGTTGGGALLLVVIIVILCALIIRKFHSTTDDSKNIKQSSHDDAGDIEMKRNEIYGQLPQQQVVRNPAYSWWYPSLNRR